MDLYRESFLTDSGMLNTKNPATVAALHIGSVTQEQFKQACADDETGLPDKKSKKIPLGEKEWTCDLWLLRVLELLERGENGVNWITLPADLSKSPMKCPPDIMLDYLMNL